MQAVDGDPGIPFRDPDWSMPDQVIDLAVSADGSVVAVATIEGLRVYDSSGNLLWGWSQEGFGVSAVEVSDDGNVVVAAIFPYLVIDDINTLRVTESDWAITQEDGQEIYLLLYWKNAKSLTGTPDPNWSGVNLGGTIYPDALAVSSNGDQVVVVGTGANVFYWNGALSRSGGDQPTTWNDGLPYWLEHVRISDDGSTIAFLGYGGDDGEDAMVAAFVYKNCKSRTGNQLQGYDLTHEFSSPGIFDVPYIFVILFLRFLALSDDGNYLVVGLLDTIYFFRTTASDGWNPLWTCQLSEGEWVAGVDISEDGSTAVAVTNTFEESPTSLSIFLDATSKTGPVSADHSFTWARFYTDWDHFSVSLDNAGELAAAGTGDYLFAVNATNGEPLWYYNGSWPHVSMMVRISEDGNAVVSAGIQFETLHYFGLEEETPPEPEPEPPKPVGGILLASEAPAFMGTAVVALSAAAFALVIAMRRKQLLSP